MNEKTKLIVIGVIVALIISIIPITAIITNTKSKNVMNKYYDYIDSKDTKLVYIGRDNCSYCQLFGPELELISDKYDVDYLEINTNNLTKKDFDELLQNLKVDSEDFGTPYLAIFKDGKKVGEKSGYLSEEALFELLKEQNLIEKDESLPLNYIDYEEYNKVITSNSKELVVIAQSGCEGCVKSRPIIYELAEEYDLKINYLNVSMFTDEAQATDFQNSLEFFKDGISTPLMMVVADKEVSDSLSGATTKEKYIEFLTKNGFIKE